MKILSTFEKSTALSVQILKSTDSTGRKKYHGTIVVELKARPQIIAVTEIKLIKDPCHINVNLPRYNFVHCDTSTRAGGLGSYIEDGLQYIPKNVSLNLNNVEDMWIDINNSGKNLTVGVVYRHPIYRSEEIEKFSEALTDTLRQINLSTSNFFLLGDFNLDLLKVDNNISIRKYVNDLISCSCKCVIDKPTRIYKNYTILLDHIYTNEPSLVTQSGIAYSDISDHLPTFVMINLTYSRHKKRDDMFFKRDAKRVKLELFLEDLKQEFSTFKVKESFPINGQFDDFTDRLAKTVNTHAPLWHATRKEKRLQKKPWLSRGILKSVAHKNKMFVDLRKNFDDSLVTRCKTYRNVLNRTIQTAKKIYYHNQLSSNYETREKHGKS